jgi:hypothetical protein
MRTIAIHLLGVIFLSLASGQERGEFGGNFRSLRPAQKRLVEAWFAEYKKITGKDLEAEAGYNTLPLSSRTTFDAVTHALENTKLTSREGASLGSALDLVQLVEAVHGKVPHVRGDHQFRVYVLLKSDALATLYKCREFERAHDNTIYHIGYPINFRQQGGTPSIQISVTRAGRRADIDVDYRSSSGPQALVNGHLTAANSDVRAGNNHERHNARWGGLANWWRDLIGLLTADREVAAQFSMDASVIPVKPRVSGSAPIDEAVYDFFQSWLVEGKPEVSMSYFSVRSYACLAEFQTGESIESRLAAHRILQHLRSGLVAYGKSTSLEKVIQGTALYAPGARPMRHARGALFSLEHLTDDAAQSMDCRAYLHINLAEPLPQAGHTFGDYYGSITRLTKEDGPATILTQLWTKEEGHWKIVSWHVEHPFHTPETPRLAGRESPRRHDDHFEPDRSLVDATGNFFRSWLVDRSYREASAYFGPAASKCPVVSAASTPQRFLASVADVLPRRDRLVDMIRTVEHGHHGLYEAHHPHSQAFLLARVSDSLAANHECGATPPAHEDSAAPSTFNANVFQTLFRLNTPHAQASSVMLQWRRIGDGWKITAAEIVDH